VSGVAPMRYPLEPFFKLTGWTMRQVSIASGTSHPNATEYRARVERGVTALVADRLAIKAGLHPAEIWPTWWDDTPPSPGKPCEECGTEFQPTRAGHRYCRKTCSQVAAQRRRRQTPEGRELTRANRRRFYAQTAEYERRRRRAYYAVNAEREKARQRAYYHAKKLAA
jgi:lambda repressor-like predicted transcriptional regulator